MSLLIAMLIDTWRELTSRFLFWIVLAISAFIVLLLTSVGFDETGISLWWGLSHSEHDLLRRGTRNLDVVYRAFFSDVLVGFWLTYAATFLGLISTASVFPDFLSGGGVDMLLAKPRRRASIFMAKFVASLLFAAVPVTLVCLGVLLSMRMALGVWEFEILYALPYVLLFYSSLFAVCVLVGTVTRSALASLLLTVVIWGLFLAAGAVESTAGFAYDQIQEDIERVQNGDERRNKRNAVAPGPWKSRWKRTSSTSKTKASSTSPSKNRRLTEPPVWSHSKNSRRMRLSPNASPAPFAGHCPRGGDHRSDARTHHPGG